MTPVQPYRGPNWTDDEDRNMLKVVEAGKS
jgi:hypothetical protein